jgi:hypothetical protein
MEGMLPFSMAVRKMLPLPVKCSCPTNSSNVVGRALSAKGIVAMYGEILVTTKLMSCTNQERKPSGLNRAINKNAQIYSLQSM